MFINTHSHRAREKLLRRLDVKPRAVALSTPGELPRSGYYEIADEQFQFLTGIKGITKARVQDRERYFDCWR